MEQEPEYILAYETGKALAAAGFTVCNGGYGGIMEASARGAKEAGGKTVGIVTDAFSRRANPWIDSSIACKSLVDRMMELVARGDAYVVLKGGTGTLLELSAIWEFMNKGIMTERPIIVVGDFWNAVVDTLRTELAWEGLDKCTKYVTVVSTPAECVRILKIKLDEKSHVS